MCAYNKSCGEAVPTGVHVILLPPHRRAGILRSGMVLKLRLEQQSAVNRMGAGSIPARTARFWKGVFSVKKKADEKNKKHAGRKFETPEAFTEKAEEYFRACDEKGELYGEAGMALYLGVTLITLRSWYDGRRSPDLQDAVQMAYLRIMSQIETDPRYQEKGGMTTRAIFLMKQKAFGGYQDKIQSMNEIAVNVKMGGNMDDSDFA